MENISIINSSTSQQILAHNIDIEIDNIEKVHPKVFIKTVKCSASLQRNTLRLIKEDDNNYYITFKYDADIDCTVTFYFFAKEDPKMILYIFIYL